MENEILQTPLGPIQIKRTSGRRHLTLIMDPWQGIQVRTNKRTSEKDIFRFLSDKKNWIEKNLEKFQAHRLSFPKKELKEGEKFPLMGQDRVLTFENTLGASYLAHFKASQLVVHCPKQHVPGDTQLRLLIRDLYKKVAIYYLSERVQKWAAEMQLFPKDLKFNESKTLWGSCSPDKKIRLNWKVMVFSVEVIDYLIIHELAHLQHLNHSKEFWYLVERFCPGFRECRKILKKENAKSRFLNKDQVG